MKNCFKIFTNEAFKFFYHKKYRIRTTTYFKRKFFESIVSKQHAKFLYNFDIIHVSETFAWRAGFY